MARRTSVSIGDQFADFIDQLVRTSRHGSASEVVRAGLRLLQEYETKVKALQDALIAGEESGVPTRFDSAVFLRGMRTHRMDVGRHL